MGYANPIEAMGTTRIRRRARATPASTACSSSTIRPRRWPSSPRCSQHAASRSIFLISPTTPDSRIAAIAPLARGYVYYVSLKGVTGAGNLDTAEVARQLAAIRRHLALPIGVGFGIRDAASAQAIAAHADAVVIGRGSSRRSRTARPRVPPRAPVRGSRRSATRSTPCARAPPEPTRAAADRITEGRNDR